MKGERTRVERETSNEDEKIYDTIMEEIRMTTIFGDSLEALEAPLLPRISSLSPPRRPWSETYAARAYKFDLPSELTALDPDNEPETCIPPVDDVLRKFPALRYCIENLPEHVRLVESSNILFHRSFAAFLHSKLGSIWINRFWVIRDPEQTYGRQPALHFATALGLEPEIRSLLASRISANSRDLYGNTALDVATSTGIVGIIRLLYEIGEADIHARQMASYDPQDPIFQKHNNVLHTAVWYGHRDATEYLLSAGAKTNIPDLSGLTALDIAVDAENSALIQLLIDKSSKHDVAHDAAKRGRLETLKWLIEKENIDPCIQAQEHPGNTPLHVAVQHNQIACVDYLAPMTLPMPGHVYNRSGLHAFHTAAKLGSDEVLDIFHRWLLDINVVDRELRSALHHACLSGKAGTAARLIRMGIDTTLVGTDGYTALELLLTGRQMECSDKQRREVMVIFKDPQTRERRLTKGGNLLHVALERSASRWSHHLPESMQSEEDGVIDILLEWGLDPCEPDSSGSTALSLAAKWNDKRFVRLLEVCDCVNIQDNLGRTPLCILLSSNSRISPGVIKVLLDKGTSLEIQDHDGRTALHHALHQPQEIFDLVIAQGKAVNVQDNDGRTPLHILMDSSGWNRPTLVKLLCLLERGANVQIKDSHARTPLDTYIWSSFGMHISRCRVGDDRILTTFEKHGCGLDGYSKEQRVKLLRELVIEGAVNDGSLAFASLGLSSPPDASPEVLTTSPAALTGIDPEILLNGVTEDGRVAILRFLVSQGLPDDQILPFFKLPDVKYLPAIISKSSERFEGEWRLAVRCAFESSADKFVEIVDPWNRTVLSLVAERGNVDVVRYLLSKNLSTESLDSFGRTALYWAARSGQLEVVKLLAEHGATPTDFAVEVGMLYGHGKTTEYLRKYAEQSNSA